eukprot:g3908.t1
MSGNITTPSSSPDEMLGIYVSPAVIETLRVVGILILVLLSGLFSGLTLGLLSLDLNQLEIVMNSDDKVSARHASKIYPVRQNGNLLLCTLLLGNVAVNSAMTVLLSGYGNGIAAFLISTSLIVIFGEILPQAACSRHGLTIGAKTVPLVKIIIATCYIIAKPISMGLDYWLGDELGQFFRKDEMMVMMRMHVDKGILDETAGKVMKGAITFKDKNVESVMTPMDKVFKLYTYDILDYPKVMDIFKSGFSRIPVIDRDERIIGLLLTKDLILIDPEESISVGTVYQVFGRRNIQEVWPEDNLDTVLKLFQKGNSNGQRSHMAVVRGVDDSGDGDPIYESPRGIITLEDIVEEILQDEIVDETDQFVHMERLDRVRQRSFDLARLRLFDPRLVEHRITKEQAQAITAHLITNVAAFRDGVFGGLRRGSMLLPATTASLSEETNGVASHDDKQMEILRKQLINMVLHCEVRRIKGGTESGADLVRRISQRFSNDDLDSSTGALTLPTSSSMKKKRSGGRGSGEVEGSGIDGGGLEKGQVYGYKVETDFCCYVLNGTLDVFAGVEHFRSEVGTLTVLAEGALLKKHYAPDFSAYVTSHEALLLIITRSAGGYRFEGDIINESKKTKQKIKLQQEKKEEGKESDKTSSFPDATLKKEDVAIDVKKGDSSSVPTVKTEEKKEV